MHNEKGYVSGSKSVAELEKELEQAKANKADKGTIHKLQQRVRQQRSVHNAPAPSLPPGIPDTSDMQRQSSPAIGFPTRPEGDLGGRVENPRPEGIAPQDWTEKDRCFDWVKSTSNQQKAQYLSIIRRERGWKSRQVLDMPKEERAAAVENLRARGHVPKAKVNRPSNTRDENFDWSNATREEKRTYTLSVVIRNEGITHKKFHEYSKENRDAATERARTEGLLEPLDTEAARAGGQGGTKSRSRQGSPSPGVGSSRQAGGPAPAQNRHFPHAPQSPSRTALGLNDDLYSDDRPTRPVNTIPGVTRPGSRSRSGPLPTSRSRGASLAARSGSRPSQREQSRGRAPALRSGSTPPQTEHSRGRSLTSRGGSRPPSTEKSRGRAPPTVSQTFGAPGSWTGARPSTNSSPPATLTKAEVAARKKAEKEHKAHDKAFAKENAAAEKLELKKRKAEVEAEKKTNAKRAAQAKKSSPKPQPKPKPGPSGGGKRK